MSNILGFLTICTVLLLLGMTGIWVGVAVIYGKIHKEARDEQDRV